MTDIPKIFADGIIWKERRENAPKWIKGSLAINGKKFFDCLKENKQFASEKGWFTIDIKESKNGTTYCEISTYKPKPKEIPESDGRTSDGGQMPDF